MTYYHVQRNGKIIKTSHRLDVNFYSNWNTAKADACVVINCEDEETAEYCYQQLLIFAPKL